MYRRRDAICGRGRRVGQCLRKARTVWGVPDTVALHRASRSSTRELRARETPTLKQGVVIAIWVAPRLRFSAWKEQRGRGDRSVAEGGEGRLREGEAPAKRNLAERSQALDAQRGDDDDDDEHRPVGLSTSTQRGHRSFGLLARLTCSRWMGFVYPIGRRVVVRQEPHRSRHRACLAVGEGAK